MDSPKFQWPDDFSEQCPPSDAKPCDGQYFRFVSNPINSEKDFVSEFNRSERLRNRLIKEGNLGLICMAKGLSIFSKYEGAIATQKRIPRFRKSAIAANVLTAHHGVLKPTPSTRSDHSHCTWWIPENVDPSIDFVIQ